MSIPNFSEVPFKSVPAAGSKAEWQASLEKATGKPLKELLWRTMEQIEVAPAQTSDDAAACKQVGFTAGIAPNLRGPSHSPP